jgi:hypothetical protein
VTAAEALARFERDLAAVERALADNRPIELPAFEPANLTGPCTVADMQRLDQVMARLNACAASILQARDALAEELDGVSRRRNVAAAYAGNA